MRTIILALLLPLGAFSQPLDVKMKSGNTIRIIQKQLYGDRILAQYEGSLRLVSRASVDSVRWGFGYVWSSAGSGWSYSMTGKFYSPNEYWERTPHVAYKTGAYFLQRGGKRFIWSAVVPLVGVGLGVITILSDDYRVILPIAVVSGVIGFGLFMGGAFDLRKAGMLMGAEALPAL